MRGGIGVGLTDDGVEVVDRSTADGRKKVHVDDAPDLTEQLVELNRNLRRVVLGLEMALNTNIPDPGT